MGRRFYVSGITVNRTTQVVESVAGGGAFHIEDVYPIIDGGRFPVKRVVGERIDVSAWRWCGAASATATGNARP
jgi:starch synthase (maltosyl-transferring)